MALVANRHIMVSYLSRVSFELNNEVLKTRETELSTGMLACSLVAGTHSLLLTGCDWLLQAPAGHFPAMLDCNLAS